MGVLTLLALVGVGVLANVRTQRTRVERIRVGVTPAKLIDGVQQTVLERLRADIWGEPSSPGGYLTGSTAAAPGGARESNEPFDAPGPFDRWLASTVPYRFDPNAVVANDEYLVWPHVSYLGSDLMQTSGLHNWPDNSRTAAVNDPTDFNSAATNDVKLANVPVAIWAPANYNPTYYPFNPAVYPMTAQPPPIPGSTTNVTIELARRVWQSLPSAWRDAHRFPYFDTDQDGIVDLYDADGDGVPDSPISFALPYSGTRNDEPREVYAVIRIVDNSSMLNLATAGARDTDGDGLGDGTDNGDLFFAIGADPDRQLRGRRTWEIGLDAPANGPALGLDIAPILDADRGATLGQLINYRFTGNLFTVASPGSTNFYSDVVRRILTGGANRSGDNYGHFRAADELALHNRNGICNYVGGGSGARTDLESALPDTLGAAGGSPGRWVRFVVDQSNPYFAGGLGPYGASGYIASFDTENVVNRAAIFGTDASGNAVPALRRPLLTTISRVCDRTPAPSAPANPLWSTLSSGGLLVPVAPMQLSSVAPGSPLWEKIDLNATSVLDAYTVTAPAPPVSRPLIDTDNTSRAIYLGNLIWAFNQAGGANGLTVLSDPTNTSTAISREKLAAQLAANVCDFRDFDSAPVVVEGGPLVVPVAGMESQPFITEVYAKCVIDDTGSTILSRYAVEIWNPYNHDMLNYQLRVEGTGGLNWSVAIGNIPAGQRITLLSQPQAQFALDPGIFISGNVQDDAATNGVIDQIAYNDGGRVKPRRIYLIRNDAVRYDNTGSPFIAPWLCDAFILDRTEAVDSAWQEALQPPNPGDPPDTKRNFYQRQELLDPADATTINWKFTIGRSHGEHPATDTAAQTLGATNTATVSPSADLVPSIWNFRDIGLTPGNPASRAFESPIELSRVLALGNDYRDLAAAIPDEPLTVPEKLALYQYRAIVAPLPSTLTAAGVNRAAGRLDFADLVTPGGQPRTGLILNYVTCSGGQFDVDCLNGACNTVDNDGDGTANTPGEFARVAFRQAGLINVNTAPAAVLRAVPWMTRAESTPNPFWDFGPAIVSLREQRPVNSIFGYPADLSANARAGQPFQTVADVIHASSGLPEFDVARLVAGGVAPADNTAAPDLSPDYDRTFDGCASAAADLRARDLFLARWGNILTTRSDVFTVYVALIDENGRYIRRSRFVVDRTNTAVEDLVSRRPTLPIVIGRSDSDYYDDMR